MSSLPRPLPTQQKTNTGDEHPCRLRDSNTTIKLLQTCALYFTATITSNIALSRSIFNLARHILFAGGSCPLSEHSPRSYCPRLRATSKKSIYYYSIPLLLGLGIHTLHSALRCQRIVLNEHISNNLTHPLPRTQFIIQKRRLLLQ